MRRESIIMESGIGVMLDPVTQVEKTFSVLSRMFIRTVRMAHNNMIDAVFKQILSEINV